MSKWRQQGYVQDSDEEEDESQIIETPEKQPASEHEGRVTVGQHDAQSAQIQSYGSKNGRKEYEEGKDAEIRVPGTPKNVRTTPSETHILERPTVSPITPNAERDDSSPPAWSNRRSSPSDSITEATNRERIASPDPLQPLFLPRRRQICNIPASSQILGESTSQRFPVTSTTPMQQPSVSRNGRNILEELGFGPLPDSSQSDSELSDPPSDLESPVALQTTPPRRTEVRVVIPSSTAAQQWETDIARRQREFRVRKPIQLHPYLLEGERYRQEFQSRGVRPVPRVRSPEPRIRQNDQETQEQDFNPNSSCSSPGGEKIVMPSPIAGGPTVKEFKRRPAHSPTTTGVNTKRRRLNLPSTQPEPINNARSNARNSHEDVWSVPQSPPYSSSPRIPGTQLAQQETSRPLVITPVPDLPTPSTSSNIPEEVHYHADSDSEPVTRSIQRSGPHPRQIISIPSSSPSENSASESEQSDTELKRQSKRMKGVLPASWLRFDQKAQARREAEARKRERERARKTSTVSPEKTGPQRGVAHKVFKGDRILSQTQHSPGRLSDVTYNQTSNSLALPREDTRRTVETATEIADVFDRSYKDDDSDTMENDPLQLFTLGGNSNKRKRQTKLDDAFGKAKRKVKTSHGTAKTSETLNGALRRSLGRRKQIIARKSKRTPPPALSILDLDASPSERHQSAPQFLKLAQRQARRRPDGGRHHPSQKRIRLHTAHDTEDALSTLCRWKQGSLQPKKDTEQQRRARPPLANRSNNQQHIEPMVNTGNGIGIERPVSSQKRPNVQQARRILDVPEGLRQLQAEQYAPRLPMSFRAAQLEGDEAEFGRSHRRIAFEKGLRRADQQHDLPLPFDNRAQNPQLARFLADDTNLPPLPSGADVGEKVERPPEIVRSGKRRLVRKAKAQRVDVDMREYRQPSEPAVDDVLKIGAIDRAQEQLPEPNPNILQGLGPFGTRYNVTFDVSPLKFATHFHSSTFVGSGQLQSALQTGLGDGRNLDDPIGYYSICLKEETLLCGPWNDETHAQIGGFMNTLWGKLEAPNTNEVDFFSLQQCVFEDASRLLRQLINYFSLKLSFSDPIDRREFTTNMLQFLKAIYDRTCLTGHSSTARLNDHTQLRTLTFILVLTFQIRQIGQHIALEPSVLLDLNHLIEAASSTISRLLVQEHIPALHNVLEKNKMYKERENGFQEEDILVESVVVCLHVLDSAKIPDGGFWDLISRQLSVRAEKATHLREFDAVWASAFTLLPYIDLDTSGILVNRHSNFEDDNWTFVRDLLKHLFSLYPATYGTNSSSLNEYVRANLTRCHVLITSWHWRRCRPVLHVMFDFFAKNGLEPLRGEESKGSIHFVENLTGQPALTVEPDENSFHIFLKCLALGCQNMKHTYPEKQIRSFVSRLTPNHGRAYPKDDQLDQRSLQALRNHHDLLCTLYWSSPPSCRPKLSLLRNLVQHEASHREACRVNVRAWANLTAFQLSTDEPYGSSQPFAQWHRTIVEQTLNQYQSAKAEAEEYMKNARQDGIVSSKIVQEAMRSNQEQVIATLRDCITGMRKAIANASCQDSLRNFLIDSGLVQLLELPHLSDARLTTVIRDTLGVIREYATLQRHLSSQTVSQRTSEESQDYGDFPDLDDLNEMVQDSGEQLQAPKQLRLDFIQTPLWHLLSNAFGAERIPEDNFLMDCIDTWAIIASSQVSSGERSWSYYIEAFSPGSWQQLRQTEQTRKYAPYFYAAMIHCDATAYEEHQHVFFTALLLCLAERESMLRFQHRLMYAIAHTESSHPLLRNLPFFLDQRTEKYDITPETVRTRRLALISSLLSNMRDHLHDNICHASSQAAETRHTYANMLKSFMTAMQANYQSLSQVAGPTMTGAYVEFVQKNVQFLKQYTSDICPVLPFFTDSAAFPLPNEDPTYVIGRLCGYAPKLKEKGVGKQLSIFMQTVAERAAIDNQQDYLIGQLTTALCGDQVPTVDRIALRASLLQCIIPAYIQAAFSSKIGFVIAKPLLQSLKPIIETMFFDLRVMDKTNVRTVLDSLIAIISAFTSCSDELFSRTDDTGHFFPFTQEHSLQLLSLMFDALAPALPLLDYIIGRTTTLVSPAMPTKPALIHYIEGLLSFTHQTLTTTITPQNEFHRHPPPFLDPQISTTTTTTTPSSSPQQQQQYQQRIELLSFCRKSLEETTRANWSERSNGCVGHQQSRRDVVVDIGSVEEESEGLLRAVARLMEVLRGVYGGSDVDSDGAGADEEEGRVGELVGEVVV